MYQLSHVGSCKETTRSPARIILETRNFCWRYKYTNVEGCEGYTYKFRFDSTLGNHDYVSLGEGQKVLFALSEEELGLVKGSTLDYIKEMMRESFYVR